MEEMEALCQSAVSNGGSRQMFTEGNALHRKALVSSLAVFVHKRRSTVQ